MIEIEPARESDFDSVSTLLAASQLPLAGLRECFGDALVARDNGRIVGSAALEVYHGGVLLRSVVVDPTVRGRGLGIGLTRAALALARARGASAAFLLTTTAGDFFPRFGFTRISRDDVPRDVRGSIEFTSACPSTALVMRADLK